MLLALAFAFIFFVARGCVATQESTQIRTYVTSSASLLGDSSNAGSEELQPLLQSAEGDPAKLDGDALTQLTDRSQNLYQQALQNEEVPPEFEDAHHYLTTSLGIRATATARIEDAAAGSADSFKEALSAAVWDYRLSDGIVRDHYLPAAQRALEETGQQGEQTYLEEPEPFMDYEEIGFGAATAESAIQDDPNARHGVEITSVEVAGQPLYPGGNVTLTGSDEPVFVVGVTNGGETPETAIPVEVILNTATERQAQTVTIEKMEPNGFATVEIEGFRVGEVNETAEVTIEAGPVKYEEFLDNNTLSGTVTFGI